MKNHFDKYRRQSRRLSGFDYSSWGCYYITICTENKQPFLGAIIDGQMVLSEAGKIVKKEWERTPDIRPAQDIFLDEYVIMPDHFHAIIIFGYPLLGDKFLGMHMTQNSKAKFKSPSKNLGAVIRGFKGACTSRIRKFCNPSFEWQDNYYDHIIRNFESLENIRNYIRGNPGNWNRDLVFPIDEIK